MIRNVQGCSWMKRPHTRRAWSGSEQAGFRERAVLGAERLDHGREPQGPQEPQDPFCIQGLRVLAQSDQLTRTATKVGQSVKLNFATPKPNGTHLFPARPALRFGGGRRAAMGLHPGECAGLPPRAGGEHGEVRVAGMLQRHEPRCSRGFMRTAWSDRCSASPGSLPTSGGWEWPKGQEPLPLQLHLSSRPWSSQVSEGKEPLVKARQN